jgi:hypothetical protein
MSDIDVNKLIAGGCTCKKKKGRSFWGPPWWIVIHSAAAAYKRESASSFTQMMNAFTELIPCDECRAHLKSNLKKFPMESILLDLHIT